MTSEDLDKLKKDLKSIQIKNIELKRAKNEKIRKPIKSDIIHFTNRLIKNFDLKKDDMGISEDKNDTGVFIFEVEKIIRDIEENLTAEQE